MVAALKVTLHKFIYYVTIKTILYLNYIFDVGKIMKLLFCFCCLETSIFKVFVCSFSYAYYISVFSDASNLVEVSLFLTEM